MSRILDDMQLRRFSGDDSFELSRAHHDHEDGGEDDSRAMMPLLTNPQHAWHVSVVVNLHLPGLCWSDPDSSGRWQRWLLRAVPEMTSMQRLDLRGGLMGDLWLRALIDALIAQRRSAAAKTFDAVVVPADASAFDDDDDHGTKAGAGAASSSSSPPTSRAGSQRQRSPPPLPLLVLHLEHNLLTQQGAQHVGRFISASAACTAGDGAASGAVTGFHLELHLQGNSRIGDHGAQFLAAHAAKAAAVADPAARVTLTFLDVSNCDVGGRGLSDLVVNCGSFCSAILCEGAEEARRKLLVAKFHQQQEDRKQQLSIAGTATREAIRLATGGRRGGGSAGGGVANNSIFSRDAMRGIPTHSTLRVVDFSANMRLGGSALAVLLPALLVCCPLLRALGMARQVGQAPAIVRAFIDATTSMLRSCQAPPLLEFLDLSGGGIPDQSILKLVELLSRDGRALRLRAVDVSSGDVLEDGTAEKAPVAIHSCRLHVRSSLGADAWRAIMLAAAMDDHEALDVLTARRSDESSTIEQFVLSTLQSPSRRARSAASAAASVSGSRGRATGGGGVSVGSLSPSARPRPGAGGASPSTASPTPKSAGRSTSAPLNNSSNSANRIIQSSNNNSPSASSPNASPINNTLTSAADNSTTNDGQRNDDNNASATTDRVLNFGAVPIGTPAAAAAGGGAAAAAAGGDGDERGESVASTAASSKTLDVASVASEATSTLDRAAKATLGQREYTVTVNHEASHWLLCTVVPLIAGGVATGKLFTQLLLADIQEYCSNRLEERRARSNSSSPGSGADHDDQQRRQYDIAITSVRVYRQGAFFVFARTEAERHIADGLVRAAMRDTDTASSFPRLHTMITDINTRQRVLRESADHTGSSSGTNKLLIAVPPALLAATSFAVRSQSPNDDGLVEIECPPIRRCDEHGSVPLSVPEFSPDVAFVPRQAVQHHHQQQEDENQHHQTDAKQHQQPDENNSISHNDGSRGVPINVTDSTDSTDTSPAKTDDSDNNNSDEQQAAAGGGAEAGADGNVNGENVNNENADNENNDDENNDGEHDQSHGADSSSRGGGEGESGDAPSPPPPAPPSNPQSGVSPASSAGGRSSSAVSGSSSPAPPPPPPGEQQSQQDDEDGPGSPAPPPPPPAAKKAPAAVDVFSFESMVKKFTTTNNSNGDNARRRRFGSPGRNHDNQHATKTDAFVAPPSSDIPAQREIVVRSPPLSDNNRRRVAGCFQVCLFAIKRDYIPLAEALRRKRRAFSGWMTTLTSEGVDLAAGESYRLERNEVVVNIEWDDFLVIKTCHGWFASGGFTRVLNFCQPLCGNGYGPSADVPLARPGSADPPTIVLCCATPKGNVRTFSIVLDPEGFGDAWPEEAGRTAAAGGGASASGASVVKRALERLDFAVKKSFSGTNVWKI